MSSRIGSGVFDGRSWISSSYGGGGGFHTYSSSSTTSHTTRGGLSGGVLGIIIVVAFATAIARAVPSTGGAGEGAMTDDSVSPRHALAVSWVISVSGLVMPVLSSFCFGCLFVRNFLSSLSCLVLLSVSMTLAGGGFGTAGGGCFGIPAGDAFNSSMASSCGC